MASSKIAQLAGGAANFHLAVGRCTTAMPAES